MRQHIFQGLCFEKIKGYGFRMRFKNTSKLIQNKHKHDGNREARKRQHTPKYCTATGQRPDMTEVRSPGSRQSYGQQLLQQAHSYEGDSEESKYVSPQQQQQQQQQQLQGGKLCKFLIRCPQLWSDRGGTYVLGRERSSDYVSYSRDYPKDERQPLRFSFVCPGRPVGAPPVALTTYGLCYIHVWTHDGMPAGVLFRDEEGYLRIEGDLAAATGGAR